MSKLFSLGGYGCALLLTACIASASDGDIASNSDIANAVDIYRLGASMGEDDTYGLSADADWALSDHTRLQVGGAYMHAADQSSSLNVRQSRAGIEQRFSRFFVLLDADYRNDNSAIETYALRARAEYRGESASLGVALARRRINITYDLGDFLRQYVDTTQHTYSTESGVRLRYAPNAFAIYANGTYYNYDSVLDRLGARLDASRVPLLQRQFFQDRLEEIRRQLGGATLRSLRLAGHLVDYSAAVGVDYRAGNHLLNIEYAREREALSEAVVASMEAGWVIPLGSAADMELRVGSASYDQQGSAYYGGISFSFYR